MAKLGKRQKLKITDQGGGGLLLDGGSLGPITLPFDDMPDAWDMGDMVDVFVYRNSDDMVMATTDKVLAEVGTCAHLSVVDTSTFGAFLDMGLPKDLLVPFKEQQVPMQKGKAYTVYVYLDNSGRIAASSKLSTRVPDVNTKTFKAGDEVSLLIAQKTDLGFKAVINGTHLGLVHDNEILMPVYVGTSYTGWVHSIREDDKINLTFHPKIYAVRDDLVDKILIHLERKGGSSTVTDKSSAEIIMQTFGCSKGAFKKAVGKLYKDRKITVTKDTIRLV